MMQKDFLKEPKISVLLPIYNTREDYLREAIGSILAQTLGDFELLVLNDSPDNTELDAILASFEDPRIVYTKNEHNLGISRSRNKLIEMARGEYLAVMDHDDVCLPERLEKQAAYLDSHPECGVVGSQVKIFPSGKMYGCPIEDHAIRLDLFRKCAVIHPAAMIRRSVLMDNGIRYENEFTPAEDHALWRRLMPLTRFHNLPDTLLLYRKHATNTSRLKRREMEDRLLQLHAAMESENPELYNEFKKTALHSTFIRLFGVIPLLRIDRRGYETKVLLFFCLPILTVRHNAKYAD